MTEARRRAAQAYKERQEREGIKVVSLRLDRSTREGIREMAHDAGISQGHVVKQLLAYYNS